MRSSSAPSASNRLKSAAFSSFSRSAFQTCNVCFHSVSSGQIRTWTECQLVSPQKSFAPVLQSICVFFCFRLRSRSSLSYDLSRVSSNAERSTNWSPLDELVSISLASAFSFEQSFALPTLTPTLATAEFISNWLLSTLNFAVAFRWVLSGVVWKLILYVLTLLLRPTASMQYSSPKLICIMTLKLEIANQS